jgi:hypothetical protein
MAFYEQVINDLKTTYKTDARRIGMALSDAVRPKFDESGNYSGSVEELANLIYDSAYDPIAHTLGLKEINEKGKNYITGMVESQTGLRLEDITNFLGDLDQVTITEVDGLISQVKETLLRSRRGFYMADLERIPQSEEQDYINHVKEICREAGLDNLPYDIGWIKEYANRMLGVALQGLDLKERNEQQQKSFKKEAMSIFRGRGQQR